MYKKYDWIKLTDRVGRYEPGEIGVVLEDQNSPFGTIVVLMVDSYTPTNILPEVVTSFVIPPIKATEDIDRFVLEDQGSVRIEVGYESEHLITIIHSDEGVLVVAQPMEGDYIDTETITGLFKL